MQSDTEDVELEVKIIIMAKKYLMRTEALCGEGD